MLSVHCQAPLQMNMFWSHCSGTDAAWHFKTRYFELAQLSLAFIRANTLGHQILHSYSCLHIFKDGTTCSNVRQMRTCKEHMTCNTMSWLFVTIIHFGNLNNLVNFCTICLRLFNIQGCTFMLVLSLLIMKKIN